MWHWIFWVMARRDRRPPGWRCITFATVRRLQHTVARPKPRSTASRQLCTCATTLKYLSFARRLALGLVPVLLRLKFAVATPTLRSDRRRRRRLLPLRCLRLSALQSVRLLCSHPKLRPPLGRAAPPRSSTPRRIFARDRFPPFDMHRSRFQDRILTAAMFLGWRTWFLGLLTEVLDKENTQLRTELGRKEDSIWHMRKAALVSKAMEVLHWSRPQAEEATVGQLRLQLKEALAASKEVQQADEWAAPKGLNRMKLAELQAEAIRRSLSIERHPGSRMTREELIRAINQHVIMPLPTTSSGTTPNSRPTRHYTGLAPELPTRHHPGSAPEVLLSPRLGSRMQVSGSPPFCSPQPPTPHALLQVGRAPRQEPLQAGSSEDWHRTDWHLAETPVPRDTTPMDQDHARLRSESPSRVHPSIHKGRLGRSTRDSSSR
jgi:hypothetical protein